MIVVTGASSGIGRAAARLLHQRGHEVWAGVRQERDAADLRAERGSPPEVAGEAIVHALTAARPRTRYLAGKDAFFMSLLPRLLPEWLLDKLRQRMLGLPTRFGALDP